jgi:hypothetical protein
MQTTIFNQNYSIFDKRFIPEFVTQNDHSRPIDMEQLNGHQFWPNQHKSSNKINKFISKPLKFLKRKFTRKNRKGKNKAATDKGMISRIIYSTFSTETNLIEVRY